MSRPRLLMVAASLAAGVVGCAHCDTCDDFPLPCNGPNCGYNAPAPAYPTGAVVTSPAYPAPTGAPAPGPGPVTSSPFTPGTTSAPAQPSTPPARPATQPGQTQAPKDSSPPNSDMSELPQ